jgi:alpha-ribazole phosphatase
VLAESLAAPQTIFPDERLLELDFGDWENQPWEWIYQNGGDAWMNAFVDQRTPGGESFIDLAERAKIFWNEKVLEKGIAGQSLAVVTHAGVIRAFLCHLLEIPLRNAFKIKLDYGSVTQVDLSATGLPNIRFVNLT